MAPRIGLDVTSTGALLIDRLKQYIWNVLIAIDQLFNALFGGDPDETISSRVGKRVKSGDPDLVSEVLCEVLDAIDENHCEESIEYDEGEPVDENPNPRGHVL